MVEQTPYEVAAAMADDPLAWAELYLEMQQQLEVVVALLEKQTTQEPEH